MQKQNNIIVIVLGLACGVIGGLSNPFIPLACLALIAAAIIVLHDYATATYAMGFYVFVDFFIRKYFYQIASIWNVMFFLGLFALWLFKWLLTREERATKLLPLDIPILVYCAANTFILFVNSPKLSLAIEGMRANIGYIFVYFVVTQLLSTRKHAKYLTYALICVTFIISLHGIYQYIMKVPMPPAWLDAMESGIKTRVFSIIGSPNILGSLLVLVAPVTLTLVLGEEKPLKKFLFLCMGGSMALCLIFTFSRGAWLGFLVAMLALVVVLDKRLFIPMIAACIGAMIFVPSISNRITYMFSSEYIASSLKAGRLVRWITGIDMFMEDKWVGVGLGRFGGAVAQNNSIKDTFYMDNYFLKIAVEMGLVGLLSFAYLMFSSIAWSFRSCKQTSCKHNYYLLMGVFAGLAGVVFHCFVENIFDVPMMVIYFYMMLGVSMHLWRLNWEERQAVQAIS